MELTKVMIKEKMTSTEAILALKKVEKNATEFPRLPTIDVSEEYTKVKNLSLRENRDLARQIGTFITGKQRN